MRLSRFRPRFTVRSLMIAVAIVGLVMGVCWFSVNGKNDLARQASR